MSLAPIGVFDSGVGGLTVLKALEATLPCEKFIYLGDTARLPYGIKSEHTVQVYSEQITRFLLQHQIKLLVIACNTASSLALDYLQHQFPDLMIVGVVKPGALYAAQQSRSHHLGILATEATIRAGGYQREILNHNPQAVINTCSCGMLVALAEEGWHFDEVSIAVAKKYLEPMFAEDNAIDTLVLGCTHFPLLKPAINHVLSSDVQLIDSAEVTAQTVAELLKQHQLQHPHQQNQLEHSQFFVTDSPERFAKISERFLGRALRVEQVQWIDL
ncbi:MAG: glutamate racemase [Legionellales bacterium]|nr:glutamate racemase [Legionellales bacterium]